MIFQEHSKLIGQHAFLSASKNHWVNYSDDKLDLRWASAMAAHRGTQFHKLANDLIKLGVRLPETEQTLNMYVNDAIGYRMSPEVVLYYSEHAFGTADSIGFRDNFLRIHDLKTGMLKTSVRQIEVYAAYFCLEYNFKPAEIGMEFRIYQNDAIDVYPGDVDNVTHIMDRIVTFDKRITQLLREAML